MPKVCLPTFNVTMEFALRMKILKPAKKLSDYDRDIFLPKDPGFHLRARSIHETFRCRDQLTRSEHEPPEQYLNIFKSAIRHSVSGQQSVDVLHDNPQIRPL
jgi:hypothetical protein